MARAMRAFENDKEETVENEDQVFGTLIGIKLGTFPDGDIKEDLKIELQQCIRRAQRAVENIWQ